MKPLVRAAAWCELIAMKFLRFMPRPLLLIGLFHSTVGSVFGACTGCTQFLPGVSTGQIGITALIEASGLAASRRNYSVLWTHNDGPRNQFYAVAANAAHLATFTLNESVLDVEDVAVGVGPTSGVSYLYIGDIGGSQSTGDVRSQVKVVRIPEPAVDLGWAGSPRSLTFAEVNTFFLLYPDGSYDAETLMVDPLTADIWIATKQSTSTRLYRVNLNAATDRQTLVMQFVRTVPFSEPSAGDISPDGTQIALRRENAARLWQRCDGESISAALARAGVAVPIIGTPTEPNGEAIAFLADNTGYMTISEGQNPILYRFAATCPRAPQFFIVPTNQSVQVGASVQLRSAAAGVPAPSYQWRFNGQVIPGQVGDTLTFAQVAESNAGQYDVVASNPSGSVTASANLTVLPVQPRPDLRITEVMANEAASPLSPTADWWELTSFATQPVNLQGWRFNDSGGDLVDPFTVTTTLTIAPGESVIFVEGLSTAQFKTWWGANNLRADLKVVSYAGSGLGLGASGDGLRLWDNVTTYAADVIARVDFGAATAGRSFTYNPSTQQFGELSQVGVNGAFRAANSSDVGSPGHLRHPGSAPVIRSLLSNSVFFVEFEATAGSRYALESRTNFIQSTWMATGDTMMGNGTRMAFAKPRDMGKRFYRVKVD